MEKIIMIGDSGHAKVIEDMIVTYEENKIIAKLDDKYTHSHQENDLYKGPTSDLNKLIEKHPESKVIIAIGSNKIRNKIVRNLGLLSQQYITLIHPSAVVSSSATIGKGTVVMPNAVINANAVVGDHVIVNSGAVVEHDTKLDDYVHISPLAAITGAVHIKEGVHVGAGASVIPMKVLNEWSTIGAGSVVIQDVPPNSTVVGSPARPI